MKRTASAVWTGTLKEGKGKLSTQSGVLSEQAYSFNSRFGDDNKATNPEELIAAAHAGCFTMATGAMLNEAGFTPDSLETHASLEMINENGGFTIKSIHLELKGEVPGIDEAKFQEIAKKAETNCPVSKVLNTTITMNAQLLTVKTA